MFTGMDFKGKFGLIDFDPSLIEQWEKPKELKRVWNLAIMSCLFGNQITWEELDSYKKDYTKGKEFR